MPDLRYHVISLISVFLALAIGILLGVAMADEGVGDAMTENIRSDLDRQQAEISELREELATEQDLLSGMSQTVTSDSLPEVTVALVAGPWADEETFQSVEQSLSSAGVEFSSVTRLESPVPEEPGASPEEPPEDYAATAVEILGYTAPADQSTVAEGSFEGSFGGPADAPEVVVFLGGGEPTEEVSDEALDALAEAQTEMFGVWTEADVRVVAAESSTTERTEIPLFQEAGVSSADNADQSAGRAAIVVLAAGGAEGSYGVKATASEPFPPLPEEPPDGP
ncbi:MAG: copper transporter [Rubrobacter sp.]|nr:copper transporter [Rubrobacter sp.]